MKQLIGKQSSEIYRGYAEKTVVDYRSDIDIDCKEIDKGELRGLVGLRESGTTLIPFTPAEKYPLKGEKVPYLFGRADREHLLQDVQGMTGYIIESPEHRIILYLSGEKIYRVDYKTARALAALYIQDTKRKWNMAKR